MVNSSVIESIAKASIIVQLILLVLIFLSIFCWAIAYIKHRQFKAIKHDNELFLEKFWKVSSLDGLYEHIDQYDDSSVARVFRASYTELKKIAESPMLNKSPGNVEHPQLVSIDNLERVIRKSVDNEINDLESRLNVLATTGSTGPFIGLFGTVWGIMGSFQQIGVTGNASLAVVAPGISEALIATAIGLAAAIPAVVLYNHFIAQIRRHEIDLNNFSADFLNIVKRNFFKGA